MIVVDDLLIRPIVGFLDVLQSIALEEMYDVEAIEADLKENQLLYEIGDISEEEYERRKAELEEELEIAREIHEDLRSGRVEVKR